MAGWRRATGGLLVGALLIVAGVAAAAQLTINTGGLLAGKGSLVTCDADGVSVTQNVSSTSVASVTVAGIAADCAGGTVKVTVYNLSDTAREGTGTIPAGGGSVTLTLASPVALKEAHFVDVFLQGP